MKKLFFPAAAAILSLCVTGCLFPEPYKEIVFYDLSTIRLKMPEDLPVLVDMFQSNESTRSQMTYLTGENQVQVDSYNRWIQQPEYLITRYLQTAFSTNQPAIQESIGFRRSFINGIRISGSVFSMRIDLKRREALLGVSYTIRSVTDGQNISTLTKSCVFTAKYHNEAPSDFAAAMSEAAEKLALQIQSEIHILQKQKGHDDNVKTTPPAKDKNAD